MTKVLSELKKINEQLKTINELLYILTTEHLKHFEEWRKKNLE